MFPGIAIAHELQQYGFEVHWLGTAGGLERNWVENANLPISEISIKGLRGNGALGWLKAPFNILRAWLQARKVIKLQSPDIVLGMGGFVCGPGGLAAKSMGVPLFLHEQNAIPGLTNKILAKFSTSVMTGFEQDKLQGDKVLLMGNPVRQGLEEIPTLLQMPSQMPPKLLVIGGSRGALSINRTLPQALKLLPEALRPQILHQTGAKTLEETRDFYRQAGFALEQNSPITVTAFIDDMHAAYQQADLVLCRSGALTVSELMAVARPAIMVPYPYAVDDHQTSNAQALVDMHGGEVLQETDMTAEVLAKQLGSWLQNTQKRQEASQAIREQAPKQALKKISQHIMTFCQSH